MSDLYQNVTIGWNLIGCPPETTTQISIPQLKETYGLEIDEQSVWSVENGAYISRSFIKPGRGYWVKVLSNTAGKIQRDLFTLTCLFQGSTHLEDNLKTSNAFLLTRGDKTYLITTAHSIIDDPHSPTARLASSVKIQRQTISTSKFWYSRYYDVAILDLSHVTLDLQQNGTPYQYSEISTVGHKSAVSSHIDNLTNRVIAVQANYIHNINANLAMDVFTYQMKPGSSGSAIFQDNKILGMVTSLGGSYDNMTLVVPIKTIHHMTTLIDGHASQGGNFDHTFSIYPQMLTQSLQSGHLEFLNQVGINDGQLVIQSQHDTIKPFDIVTGFNKLTISKDLTLSEAILENVANKGSSNTLNVKRITDDWNKKYRTIPPYFNLGDGLVNVVSPYIVLTNNFSLTEISNGDSSNTGYQLTITNVSIKKNESKTESLTMSDLDNLFLAGQQVMMKGKDSNIHQGYIKKIDYQDKDDQTPEIVTEITTIIIQLILNDNPNYDEINKVIIFNRSEVHFDLKNSNLNNEFSGAIQSSFLNKKLSINTTAGINPNEKLRLKIGNNGDIKLVEMNDDDYKLSVILFLARHWAILNLTILANQSPGRITRVWSTESRKFIQMLYTHLSSLNSQQKGNWFNNITRVVLQQIYHIIPYLSLNLMNIFWQNWTAIFVDEIAGGYEISIQNLSDEWKLYDTNVLDNDQQIIGKEIEYIQFEEDGSTPVDFITTINEIDEGSIIEDVNRTWSAKVISSNKNFTESKLTLGIIMLSGKASPGDKFKWVSSLANKQNSNDKDYVLSFQIKTGSQISKKVFSHIKDGLTFNNLNANKSIYYQLKPYLSQNNPENADMDYLVREIELCLREMDNVFGTPPSVSKGYQPSFFGALQSFWDHSHLTMAGIMDTLNDTSYSVATETIDLTLSNMSGQEHLSTWNFRWLSRHKGSGS